MRASVIIYTIALIVTFLNAAGEEIKQGAMDELAVFKHGTLREAQACVQGLESELKKNPDNDRTKKLIEAIQSVFRAEFAITKAAKEKSDAVKDLKLKTRGYQIAAQPSSLSGRVNYDTVNRAKRGIINARSKIKKAIDDISEGQKNLEATLAGISSDLQLQDREVLYPVWQKVAARNGLSIEVDPEIRTGS